MADLIIFIKGTSKADKAAFLVGKEKVPAAVVTRLLFSLHGLSGPKLDRTFYQGLAKYPAVLDSLDAHEVTPIQAVERFQELQSANRPTKAEGLKRASKVERMAEATAKVLCKRFKGSSSEIVEEFLQVMRKPEFKVKVQEFINGFEESFGKNGLGYIKTSARKGNPEAKKALAKARTANRK